MNIGIVVYSRSGNTYSVALKLEEKLAAAGHAVTLERLETVGEPQPGDKDIRFQSLPDLSQYDALVFGSAVEAFSLSQIMATYLKQVVSLEGKKVAFLVTQAFPYRWLGGNRAVRQMTRACESKGATVCGSGIVNWMHKRREQRIVDVTDRLSGLF